MRLTVLVLLLMVAMLIHCTPRTDVPSGSSGSFTLSTAVPCASAAATISYRVDQSPSIPLSFVTTYAIPSIAKGIFGICALILARIRSLPSTADLLPPPSALCIFCSLLLRPDAVSNLQNHDGSKNNQRKDGRLTSLCMAKRVFIMMVWHFWMCESHRAL